MHASQSDNDAGVLATLDEIGEHLLRHLPETATLLGIDTGARAALRSQLTDRSAEGRARLAEQMRSDLARASALETTSTSYAIRTSVDVVKSAYATGLEGLAMPYGDTTVGGWRNTPYVVIQNTGAYLDIPRMLDADHRIENAADAEAYLERMRSYARQLDGETDRIAAARAFGLVAPGFLIDKALAQIRLTATNTRDGGSLVDSVVRRTKAIPGNWAERARAIARNEVAPALERQIAELEAERAVATNEPGMWARPRGEEFYRWALRAATTTTMSPDEIHDTGKRDLEELHAQMDAILTQLGYPDGSVGQRMRALANDPAYQFSDDDAGRAEIMAFVQRQVEWIRTQMPRAFHTLVNPTMEVRRLPPEEEPGAATAYGSAGSIDGTIPGRFWINLRSTRLHTRYDLADLTFHESIPGHIWQGEYTHQMPRVRQILGFSAYAEGWALYAEQLADELGAYEDNVVGRLGYLQSIAFRACRLVVDTGLHAKRWTRDQAIQYFVETNGSNPLEVASEVDRYCAWPGQACAYKIGHSEINRQRRRAVHALGARFDSKAFNDALVLGGDVPLDVLARNVDEFLLAR